MIDTHTSARCLTERGLFRRLVDAMIDARPQLAEHGDPACGCGNFLIIAYHELRTLGDRRARQARQDP